MTLSIINIKTLLLAGLFLSFISCSSFHSEEVGEDFALIYIASSLREDKGEYVDPIDKNAFFIEGAVVYSELVKRGVKPKNIYFLYKDGQPDFDDPLLSHMKGLLEAEFKELYDHSATFENLQKVEFEIQRQLKHDSNFFLVLDGHGLVDKFGFKLRSEADRTYIRSGEIEDLVKGNRGRNHLFIGSCYSGHFLRDVTDLNARVVTAAPADKAVWLDRDLSFAREYFRVIPENLDASLAQYEDAFYRASESFNQQGVKKMLFIRTQYEGKGHEEHDTLEWIPQQKNFNTFN